MTLFAMQPLIPAETAAQASYLAVHVSGKSMEDLQVLTPRMMRWDEDVWLLDLGPCVTYWRMRAESLGRSLGELFRTLLSDVAQGGEYRAAQATTPWQAVLLLDQMRERGLKGLVSRGGPFGQGLFRELSWSVFWRQAERLSQHLEALPTGMRRADGALFHSQKAQMQRAVKRLGLKTPWHLSEAGPEAIKRRFGRVMRDVWEWTYGREEHGFPSGFPWMSQRQAEKPSVRRHLDYPVVEWAQVEPLLREELDRLCALESFHAGERVVSLEWRIVFRDMSHLVIPIRFRHPHSLHLERPRHGTALLQALYAFESSLAGTPLDKARAAEELIPIEPIVSWELTVTERLVVPDRWLAIFGDGSSSSDAHALLALENRLSIPLERYGLEHDWFPEDSFGLRGPDQGGENASFSGDPAALPSLLALARQRPLFLLQSPVAFESQGRSPACEFTERTMAKWWSAGGVAVGETEETAGVRPLQRDYYRLTDSRGRTFWVYRNPADLKRQDGACKWIIHGVFG